MTKPWTAEEVSKLQAMRANGESSAAIASALGRSQKAVQNYCFKLGDKAEPKEGCTFEANGETGVASSLSRNIKTLGDLLDYAKVDRNTWEVERFVVNKWDMGYKDADKEAQSHPLYQIKAWLKRRIIVEKTRELIKEMLVSFREQAPKPPKVSHVKKGCLLEISIFDLHLGKLCWAPESGTNYDAKIAQSAFNEAVEVLLHRARGFEIERILMPVGNDFFNVDNSAQTTTKGTPQHEDVRWQKSFVAGRKLMLQAILRLREIAPVDVVMVSGNHDRERVFYLGDALSGWLSKTDAVTVNNEPTSRKYYQFGKCMIGFTHGNEEKHARLPLIMATEAPQMWSATKFREIHMGHWHHKQDTQWQPTVEHNGIRVRIIPSLCPPDAWHKMKGYEGLKSAEAYLWDREQGQIGSFAFNN